MLDVFAVVLSLARDCGRTICSLRLRTEGLRFSSRGNADGVGREEAWPGSGERLDFDRLKAVAISLNAVGGEALSTLVRGVPVAKEPSDVGLVGTGVVLLLCRGLEYWLPGFPLVAKWACQSNWARKSQVGGAFPEHLACAMRLHS
jgi:hypothetical protein